MTSLQILDMHDVRLPQDGGEYHVLYVLLSFQGQQERGWHPVTDLFVFDQTGPLWTRARANASLVASVKRLLAFPYLPTHLHLQLMHFVDTEARDIVEMRREMLEMEHYNVILQNDKHRLLVQLGALIAANSDMKRQLDTINKRAAT